MAENSKIEWTHHTLAEQARVRESNPINQEVAWGDSPRNHPGPNVFVVLGTIATRAGGHDISRRSLASGANRAYMIPRIGRTAAVSTEPIKKHQHERLSIRRNRIHATLPLIGELSQSIAKLWVSGVSLASLAVGAISANGIPDNALVGCPSLADSAPACTARPLAISFQSKRPIGLPMAVHAL